MRHMIKMFLIVSGIIFTTSLVHAFDFIELSDITKTGQSYSKTRSSIYIAGTGTIAGAFKKPKQYSLVIDFKEPLAGACLDLAKQGFINRALKLTVQSNSKAYTGDGVNYYVSGVYQCDIGF